MMTYIFNDSELLESIRRAALGASASAAEQDRQERIRKAQTRGRPVTVTGGYGEAFRRREESGYPPVGKTAAEVETTYKEPPAKEEKKEAVPANRTEKRIEYTLPAKDHPAALRPVESKNPRVTSRPQSEKAADTQGDKTNATTTTPTSTQTQNTPTESSTMSDKPKSTGSHTGAPSNTGAPPSINELLEEKQKGALLTGDRNAYKLTEPHKLTVNDMMHLPLGFAMKNTAFAGPSVQVAYDDNGQPGWMMTGTNVPKAFRAQKSLLPLDTLMSDQFFGFINDDGSLDREADIIYENRYVVGNLKQAASRFFEALSICRNANNGNMSPEYQRAMAQFAQFGHVVLSMLKSYGLEKNMPQYGFAQSPAPTTGTGYPTASQPTGSGTTPTNTNGHISADELINYYIDELASRRKAAEQIQTDPQLWYLRGLNL